MELQISYSICAKIQKNILWRKTRRNREDIERTGRWKEVNIIETEVCLDHIHMLVEIPPKISVSSFMGFLKGKSSIIIHERHANLKYKHGNRSFWCRGYYVDTAGKNTKKIAEYIKTQLEEDKINEQLTFREYEDPFKGSE